MSKPKNLKTRKQRFEEVAPIRVTRVIKALRSLSNCSSKNYEYDAIQVKKMMQAIRSELKECENMFTKKNTKKETEFKF